MLATCLPFNQSIGLCTPSGAFGTLYIYIYLYIYTFRALIPEAWEAWRLGGWLAGG